MNWRHWVFGCGVCLTAWGAVPQGQNRKPPALENAASVTCAFTVLATGDWVKGTAQSKVEPAKLILRYSAIDVQDGTAEADLGFGPTHLSVRYSEGTLHFIHVGTSGPVYLTTVFSHETVPGRLRAVHTRHEYTPVRLPGFTSRPEQYYGDCEPTF